ncbi:MAG: sensor histidine kinase [Chloroflexota bacterium]
MRLRLFLAFAVVAIVSIAGVVLLARQGVAREINLYMFHGGVYGAENLVRSLEQYYERNRSWAGVDALVSTGHGAMSRGQRMSGMMGQQRLRLADAAGNVLVDTGHTPGTSPSGRLSDDELARSIPLTVSGETVGYLLPAGGTAFTAADSTALLNRWNRAALVAALIGGGVSLLLALLLAYHLLRPVRDLTQAATALSHGDLAGRVPVRGSDEMAQLGQTFNRMAESLQQAETSRRALTADIAHELRTPLAVQRAGLEAMQDGVFPMTVENLQPVIEQNLLLTRLVEDLRTLAMADAGQLTLERAPTDFAALARRVIERFLPSANARQVRLSLDLPIAALPTLSIDPLRIEQILNNLISNALRYTPEQGAIACQLSVSGEKVTFTVHDSGPGIPPDALPHVFERFYRADKARSRAEGGSGLGLTIARQLADAHGGALTAENHQQGGALFRLTLPLL